MTRTEHALELFSGGYNCAQAVIAAFTQGEIEEEKALRLGSALGEGLALRGETCGAATGAVVAIGLVMGSEKSGGRHRRKANKLAKKFMKDFEHEFGTSQCNPMRGKPACGTYKGGGNDICPRAVETAARLLEDILPA